MQDTLHLLKDQEVGSLIGCSRSTVWRRVADGTLPRPVKIGHMSRFVAKEIYEVIEASRLERNQS